MDHERAVVADLGNAFTHAVAGDVDATRAALIAAHASLFHLRDAEGVSGGTDRRFWPPSPVPRSAKAPLGDPGRYSLSEDLRQGPRHAGT
ncbi:hypothetical protein GCM10009634_74060 [Saccharothrix xinjiangensis]